MAKRMKLTNNVVMDKVLHLNQLLETRDSDKLRKLDDQLSTVASKQDIPLSQKLREFEETLAEYRRVLDKIIRAGSTSMLDGNVEKVVQGLMKKFFEVNREKDSVIPATAPDDVPVERPSTPAATPAATPVSSRVSSGTPIVGSEAVTTNNEEFFSPQYLTKSLLHKKLNAAMDKQGLIKRGKRILFAKIPKADFAVSNYDKVMNYLTSDKETTLPYNTERLVKLVYDQIKDEIDENVLENFPNMKSVAKSVDDGNTWNELDT